MELIATYTASGTNNTNPLTIEVFELVDDDMCSLFLPVSTDCFVRKAPHHYASGVPIMVVLRECGKAIADRLTSAD